MALDYELMRKPVERKDVAQLNLDLRALAMELRRVMRQVGADNPVFNEAAENVFRIEKEMIKHFADLTGWIDD